MLQQQIRCCCCCCGCCCLLLLLRASLQQKEVVAHHSGRKPLERAVGVATLCGSWYLWFMGWPTKFRREKNGNKFTTKDSVYACTFSYGTTHGPARRPARQIHGPVHGNGGPTRIEQASHGASPPASWAGPAAAHPLKN